MAKKRCWGDAGGVLMRNYHDNEWGVPVHNDSELFEFLILESVQAGLSWSTILNKRENYRRALDNFDFEKIAKYKQKKIDEQLQNPGIIRNKLKVNATVTNAQAFIKIRKEFGTFDKYIWNFVNNVPIQSKIATFEEMPAKTELSGKISKDLKKRGFKFVGPTIIYALMQSIGMVNDHLTSCFRYKECQNIK